MNVASTSTSGLRNLFLCFCLALGCAGASADDSDPTAVAAGPVNEKYKIDVKKLFATSCSWCHPAYGMKAADGPRLAGTAKTREQVVTQITNGKSPMPGFRKMLKEEQIQALADYIKALPAQ